MTDAPAGVSIRRATEADAATIRALVRAERLDPTTLKWPNFLVAEDDAGRIVGIGQVKPLPGARELGSLVVVPDWRERGVGGALIRALVAQESGALYLVCRDTLAPYYRKFGFRDIGWRDMPWALRAKFGLGQIGRLLGYRGAFMKRV
ncbi:MAG: GNAT family N-acetyltransferase [Anaerolineae bacterium]